LEVEAAALELIELCYDAALAPAQWLPFMARLAQSMGARSALLREVNYDTGEVGLFQTVGYDPAYVAAYREHFVHVDYFAPALARAPLGVAMRGNQVVPWEIQRKTEYYNDYSLPQSIRHAMGIILDRSDGYHLLFALQREARQGDYDEEDLQLIRLIAPHMTRAVKIHRQMSGVAAQNRWAMSALDRLRLGVILLDEQGKPLFINQAAEHLTRGRSGLVAGRTGLALPSAAETARLRRLIADAAMFATGRGGTAGGCLRVGAAPGSQAALQFHVIPLSRNRSEQPWERSLPGGCVAVFVSAPGRSRLPWGRVAAMHGLTRAEARLGSMLAAGISLEEAAEALSVSVQTVRSQLKSVFAKTGVTRQAELVALLLSDMLSDQADDPAGFAQ